MISVRLAKPSEFDYAKKFMRSIFPDAIIRLEEGDTLIFAEQGGNTLGFAHIIEDEERILLQGLGVKSSARGQGVGTFLLQRALELLEGTHKPIYIKVKLFNPAVELYARHGFFLKRFGDAHVLVKTADA